MFKTRIFNLISGKVNEKYSTIKSKNNQTFFDINKPFAVVRDDGKLIHQFCDHYEASVFSLKLNISYEDNGIKAFSKVMKLSD